MANWWENDPIVEETPDFSDVRASGSTNAQEREAARQFFAGGGYYSVPPVQTEHFDPSTPEGALNLAMATGVGTAGLSAVAPAAGAFLATPAGGAVTGALPGLAKADPWAAVKGAAYGAAAGGVGGKLIPFLLRLRTPAAAVAAPATAGTVPVAAATPAAVAAAESAVPVAAAPATAAGREAFEAGSAELAKMLGQTAAPATKAAAAVAPKVAATIQPGSEAWFYANRLRQVAETSAVNKKMVLEAIKKEYAEFGFPSAKAMTDFIFSQRTRP